MEITLPSYAVACISPLTGPWDYNRWARDFQTLTEYQNIWQAYSKENINVKNDSAMGLLKLSLDPAIRATIPNDDLACAYATTRMKALRLRNCKGISEYIKEHYQLQADIRGAGQDFDEQAMILNIAYGLTPDYQILLARDDILELFDHFDIAIAPLSHWPPALHLLVPGQNTATNLQNPGLNLFIGVLLCFEASVIQKRQMLQDPRTGRGIPWRMEQDGAEASYSGSHEEKQTMAPDPKRKRQ
ncbi:hypothetical protein H2200_010411 [Cladophialophora chaetospira]|uniref:Uncharacterized protein n=1 Tax=Cladophialophora chaetospira TaxID=386627 RepID=A0AA38X1F3_9EURO|nr:hypothetical protein H2200_010411 [Cladophialophora chaetospira]